MDPRGILAALQTFQDVDSSNGNAPPLIADVQKWLSPGKTMERRWSLVSSSLNILHNLVKSKANHKYFDNPETKRVLHFYKGSDNLERSFPACLTLGYVVDKEKEVDLINDENGAIQNIAGWLQKCLQEGPQTYSIGELVEGLDNLSSHPQNKENIMSTVVPILFELLEKSEKSENDVLQRFLSKLDLYSDDQTAAPGKEDTMNLDGTSDTTCEDKNVMETCAFVETLVGSLAEMKAEEAKDVLDAINVAIHETAREKRKVIAETIGGADHGLEILMNLAFNFYGNGDDDLYLDDLRWENLNSVNAVFWNCADASLQFASAAGDAGYVKFLLNICQQHHSNLKDKFLAVADLICEYFGNPPVSAESVPDKSEQPTSPEVVEDQPENVSVADEEVETSEDKDVIRFVAAGERAGLKDSGRVAYRIDSEYVTAVNKAVFVTDKPLGTGRPFEIKIDKMDTERLRESLEFGVTMYKEFPDDVVYHGQGYGEGSGFWFLRNSDFVKDFTFTGGQYGFNLDRISEGDRIAVIRLPNKTLHYYYNGTDQGIAFRNIPEGVYPLVAVTGKCLQVSVVDKPSKIDLPAEMSEDTETEYLEPVESFKFTTGLKGTEDFGRLRSPWGKDFLDESRHPDETRLLDSHIDRDGRRVLDLQSKQSETMEGKIAAEKRFTQGRASEADLLMQMREAIGFASLLSNPMMRIDPISKEAVVAIQNYVSMHGLTLSAFETSNVVPKEPNKLTGRLADVFTFVLKPCFDNLNRVDGYVWTGSTSEGFAITDHSARSERYLNDEMDLMIPVAMVTEALHGTLDEKVTDDVSKVVAGLSGNDGDGGRGDLEHQNTCSELLVSELERVGLSEGTKDDPPLQWVKTSLPGYVHIQIRKTKEQNFTEKFINGLCITITPDGDTENKIYYLSRSKLLKVQEDYVRSRIPAVQVEIDTNYEQHGGFRGRVELLQQGPVQTLSVFYTTKSLQAGLSSTTAEFEQTVDGALALVCKEWPSISMKWETRDRKWPTDDVVRTIMEAGCHIVPKSYPGEGGDDCLQWRLSFSLAERTLAHTFTEKQRMFYLVVKKLWRTFLKEPKVLSSYHMKTTMFWVSERTPTDQWEESNLGDRYMDYFDRLIRFLEQGNVPNFFLPENNMLSHISKSEIEESLKKVRDVRRKPLFYMKDLCVPTSMFNVRH
ncbi:uncharacterized protein [Ptychodera flava]|uniref:uncharacterized protein isoform X2 n=1 Tax=Ptychodera flava TaxID=63121 RepID=UPI003969F1CA